MMGISSRARDDDFEGFFDALTHDQQRYLCAGRPANQANGLIQGHTGDIYTVHGQYPVAFLDTCLLRRSALEHPGYFQGTLFGHVDVCSDAFEFTAGIFRQDCGRLRLDEGGVWVPQFLEHAVNCRIRHGLHIGEWPIEIALNQIPGLPKDLKFLFVVGLWCGDRHWRRRSTWPGILGGPFRRWCSGQLGLFIGRWRGDRQYAYLRQKVGRTKSGCEDNCRSNQGD